MLAHRTEKWARLVDTWQRHLAGTPVGYTVSAIVASTFKSAATVNNHLRKTKTHSGAGYLAKTGLCQRFSAKYVTSCWQTMAQLLSKLQSCCVSRLGLSLLVNQQMSIMRERTVKQKGCPTTSESVTAVD